MLSNPSLHIFFGPMRSGKSTELRTIVTQSADLGLKTLYINSKIDVREKLNSRKDDRDGPTSHHSSFYGLSTKIDYIKVDKLEDVDVSNYQIIGIDEGQFFHDIVKVVRKWLFVDYKTIYISSLDGDFEIRPFGHVSELICIASTIRKFSAKCMMCLELGKLRDAPYTGKLKTVPKIEGQILVGGDETYISLCLHCHEINSR